MKSGIKLATSALMLALVGGAANAEGQNGTSSNSSSGLMSNGLSLNGVSPDAIIDYAIDRNASGVPALTGLHVDEIIVVESIVRGNQPASHR